MDNVLGRNIKPFDRDAFITTENISIFDSTSNKTLLTDVNSGDFSRWFNSSSIQFTY